MSKNKFIDKKMGTNKERPFITREMIQLSLEQFFDRGGKIIETETPYGKTPIMKSFYKKEQTINELGSKLDTNYNIEKHKESIDQEIGFKKLKGNTSFEHNRSENF